MSETRYLGADDLPPRPDPTTGRPRPPHAPGFLHLEVSESSGLRERDPDRAPAPPPGQSPVLVWFRASRRGSLTGGAVFILIILGLTSLSRGFDWLVNPRYWGVWCLCAAMLAGMILLQRAERFSAGADWLARGRTWVRIYELEKVACHGYPWGAGLSVRDSAGRTLRYRLTDLSSDRLLWDLAYNGILHSVIAGGAATNRQVRKSLDLPIPRPPDKPGAQA